MQRWFFSFAFAVLVTGTSFYGMAKMIAASGQKMSSEESASAMNFIRVKRSPDLDVKQRKKPEPPKTPKTPPKMPKINIAQSAQDIPNTPSLDMPKFDIPLSFGSGPAVAGQMAASSGDTDVIPLVRIEPQYPRKAAMAGTEGWVQLTFDISESGTVENVEVINAEPKRVFDRAAIQSLLKWKYKPKVVEGKSLRQEDNRVQIDFKLRG